MCHSVFTRKIYSESSILGGLARQDAVVCRDNVEGCVKVVIQMNGSILKSQSLTSPQPHPYGSPETLL